MKHLGTTVLETGRLILRPFTIEDAQPMYDNWASDPEVTKYLTWPPHASVGVTKDVLAGWIAGYERADCYVWAITVKPDGPPIGSIATTGISRDDIAMVHIGYCIGRKWWRQGYTSEALAALIRFFFEEVGVNRVEARHDPRNPNSGAVMRKCVMKLEAVKRQADRNNQGVCDCAEYAILAEDYFQNGKRNL